VFDRIIKQIREKVRTRKYVISLHADEEMDEDDLMVWDVEHALLTGSIIERQRDHDTHEWKYLVRGQTLNEERDLVVVVKFSPTGKLIWVTVYGE
jgi:hypothetical protein